MWKKWLRDDRVRRIDHLLRRNGIESQIATGSTGPIDFCDGRFTVREISPDLEQIGDKSLTDDMSTTVKLDAPLLALLGHPSPGDGRFFETWGDLKKVLAKICWRLRQRR